MMTIPNDMMLVSAEWLYELTSVALARAEQTDTMDKYLPFLRLIITQLPEEKRKQALLDNAFLIPTIKPDWAMPEPPAELCDCGKPLTIPIAYNGGEGWELRWECADLCGESAAFITEWPFEDDRTGSDVDLAALGFEILL
jgi:hypothetical protein